MTISPLILGAGGMVLAAASSLLLLGGGSDRRLRERVIATQEIRTETTASDSYVLIDPDARANPLVRAAKMLGYRPDLPKPYALSLNVVGLVALGIVAIATRLLETLLPVYLAVLLGIAIAVFAAHLAFNRKVKAFRLILFRQLPDTMALLLRAVRAGLPVAEAIGNIGRESMSPTREEFSRVAGETALGMPIDMALTRLYHRTQVQEYAFFAVVIGLHRQTGGNLSETLENLADMVRRRVAMAGKAKALAAEGRLSAIVVGALPFVVGVLICFVNPDYMQELVKNAKGQLLIAAFFILLTLGMFTSHLLIQRSTQD